MKLKPKQRAFLAAYAQSCTLKAAAVAAKVARRSHYHWLEEPEYAAAFAEVREQVADFLEAEARRRAVYGIEKRVIYQGKLCYQKEFDPKTGELRSTDKPLTIREYSTSLLIFLLKAARPEKYRDNWTGEIPHSQAAPRIDLSRLNDAERKELKALARNIDSKRRTG